MSEQIQPDEREVALECVERVIKVAEILVAYDTGDECSVDTESEQ